MEFSINAAGKRVYPSEFKRKMLSEMDAGASPHELGRRYGIPIQNLVNWRKGQQLAALGGMKGATDEDQSIPLAEYRRLMEENRNLRRSLANMTLDRDILKEANDIAVKKKWISPGKSSGGGSSK